MLAGTGRIQEKNKGNRRNFLKQLFYFLWLPILAAIGGMISRQQKLQVKKADVVVNASEVPDFLVLDRVIISRQEQGFLAFENRCTHLGCTIREVRGGQLHCPCHGSRFDRQGLPVKGPAQTPLHRLSLTYSAAIGKIIVKVEG
ncbi:MAG: ubiquinol-cytochrome c reductase iron-sulfur subunit [Bacteroidales bacterium]